MTKPSLESIRKQLVQLLLGQGAHMPFEDAIMAFPLSQRNTLFPNGSYSFWHLLEHIRMTQYDILDYIKNPSYIEPKWPIAYWPEKRKQATEKDWKKTIQSYYNDRESLQRMIEDPSQDIFAPLEYHKQHTFFREIQLVVDHTSYHIGEFAIMRQVLGMWGKTHP